VNDPDRATTTWFSGTGDDLRVRLSAYEDSVEINDHPSAGPATGLVSLGFLWAALKRTARFWGTLAVVGLIIGAGYAVKHPPAHAATVSILLVDDPNEVPANEAQTDIILAESLPVATAVVKQLGLSQTPVSFASTYSVTSPTPQVLMITAKGTTSTQAVQIASALATEFLKFRAQFELGQQQEAVTQLNQQVTAAQQKLDSLNEQISQVTGQPTTPAQQANLSSLHKQLTAANTNLNQVQQYVSTTLAQDQTTAQAMVHGSQVLDAATAAKRSPTKTLLTYAIIGLIGGLAVGMVVVVIGAITSDRLRRRDDIAYAFGAPVRLSVGPLRQRRLGLALNGRGAAAQRRDMELVVEHLRNAVPGRRNGPVGFAVVAVDDEPTVARAVVDLADSQAQHGMRVIVADLSRAASAARLLNAQTPGINQARLGDARVLVVVPAAEDASPTGPLKKQASPESGAQTDPVLAKASADADLVVSLVTLDPAHGADYLSSWATDVVAVVTAGGSTAVRIHAVSEMVRLSGARLRSVVVIGADKSDESIGLTSASV
jgi:capsular polysaccharide biosynthesis protein